MDDPIPPMSVEEAAGMDDGIHAVRVLRSRDTFWCDVCLSSSVVLIVRRTIQVDVDGAACHEGRAGYCLTHNEFVADPT